MRRDGTGDPFHALAQVLHLTNAECVVSAYRRDIVKRILCKTGHQGDDTGYVNPIKGVRHPAFSVWGQ